MNLGHARILVAGSSGFVGAHLVACLRQRGADVVGVSRSAVGVNSDQRDPDSSSNRGPTAHIAADLRDPELTRRVIHRVRPTHIFHCAGVLAQSAPDWESLYQGHVVTTINLLEAVNAEGLDPWMLLASSSAVYGAGGGETLTEQAPFEPISLYGVAKATQELLGIQAQAATNARIVRARLFNVIGPDQPPSLVISDVARQVATAELGSASVIEIGNLEPERDYVDARDVSLAMVLLAEAEAPSGAYNVASGRPRSVGECVDVLVRLAHKHVVVKSVSGRRRPLDIPRQVGDSARLRNTVGWSPRIAFEDSLRDVLDHWRSKTIT